MVNEVKKINFEGGELLGVRTEDGQVWLSVKKACLDIGLSEKQGDNEVRKVRESLLFSDGWRDLPLKFEGQVRRVIVLLEKFVPMWLAQIRLTPNMKESNPDAVQKLLTYQLKAADALHEAFMGTEQQRQEFYDAMGLKGEIIELKHEIIEMRHDFQILSDYTTINTHQAQQLNSAGRKRVNLLLGGAHSEEYYKNSRIYFKNMWIQFCDHFKISSYRDLSPIHMPEAYDFLINWTYQDNNHQAA